MKSDFTSAAKGMEKNFIFRGYQYHLETDLDANGDVKAIRLDSETVPLALRVSLERECALMSKGLQMGDSIDGLIDTFAIKAGDALYPLVIVEDNKALSSLAPHVWGAATQVLKREYRAETVMTAPQKPKVQHKFRVLDGGLA